MINNEDLNIMTIKNKLNNSTSTTAYVDYGKIKNAQWDAETKIEGLLERAKQASRVLVDEIIATGGKQIDLIFEKGKEKPFRNKVISALDGSLPLAKFELITCKDKVKLKKPANKTELSWCLPSFLKKQSNQIEKSDQRTFITKADVKNFLTNRRNTAISDLRAMVAYRLEEEVLAPKDAKEGIAPTKRADKKAVKVVKKERVDTAPKSDIQKIHALLNEIIAIWQNTTCPILKKVNVMGLSLVQKIVNLIK
jgi:hypothetical protein